MKLLDCVALKHAFPEFGLEEGQEGAIVEAFGQDQFEVEFVNPDGTTSYVGPFSGDVLRVTYEHPVGS